MITGEEDTCDQTGKPYTSPFLGSAYYHYFHSLLTAPVNAPPSKHSFTTTVPKQEKNLATNLTSCWDQTGILEAGLRYITIYANCLGA